MISLNISPQSVARASRCHRGGMHNPMHPRHIGGEFEASAVETRLNRAMGLRTVLASFSAAAAGGW